jgi:hypothetical protein
MMNAADESWKPMSGAWAPAFRLLAAVVCLLGLSSGSPAALAAPWATPAEAARDLGVPISSTTLQGSTSTVEPDGTPVFCSVIRGEPARLYVIHAVTGELLRNFPLAGAKGAWNATTATDGSVYVGTDANGRLYRYIPGEDRIHDLGQVMPGQTWVWDVVAGRDGEVFGATFPGCLVFRYHPEDGFSDVGGGPIVPEEKYARALAYHEESDRLFVGIATRAYLFELNPRTGKKTALLEDRLEGRTWVYAMALFGDRLLAQVEEGNHAFVIDARSHAVEAVLEGVSTQLVASEPSPYDGRIYYYAGARIRSYDPVSQEVEILSHETGATVWCLRWMELDDPEYPGHTLVGLTQRGWLVRYHPPTGRFVRVGEQLPGEPVPVHSLHAGSDGRIYTGGYLSGGFGIYDPQEDRSQHFHPISQIEYMANFGTDIYLGLYPRGRLFVFDSTKPWDGRTNPQQVGSLHQFHQTRPVALLAAEDLGKLFIGTIPDYGHIGGVFAEFDRATGELEVFPNFIENQAIVSLARTRNGLVVGSTTISAGGGVAPATTDSQLFLYDPVERKKILELAPVPNTWIVSGLVVLPDGMVWGMADGHMFVFDPEQREVVYTRHVLPIDHSRRMGLSRDAYLALHEDGLIYGTAGGRLFRIDPATRSFTLLIERNASLLALDGEGRVYFRDRTNLWQFNPPPVGED